MSLSASVEDKDSTIVPEVKHGSKVIERCFDWITAPNNGAADSRGDVLSPIITHATQSVQACFAGTKTIRGRLPSARKGMVDSVFNYDNKLSENDLRSNPAVKASRSKLFSLQVCSAAFLSYHGLVKDTSIIPAGVHPYISLLFHAKFHERRGPPQLSDSVLAYPKGDGSQAYVVKTINRSEDGHVETTEIEIPGWRVSEVLSRFDSTYLVNANFNPPPPSKMSLPPPRDEPTFSEQEKNTEVS
jgi:hypothetical protein